MSGSWTDIEVPGDGDLITQDWGESVADALNGSKWVPHVLPIGMSQDVVSSSTVTLAAVSAGLGGVTCVPLFVPGIMSLQSVQIRQGSTASAREAEFGLYTDDGTTTLQRVTGTTGTFSFTPSAVDDRTANVAGVPKIIGPGIYWLVIRNTSTSQTFVIRRTAPTELIAAGFGVQLTTASTAALGATLDTTGFSGPSGIPLVRLQGRVLGKTAAL